MSQKAQALILPGHQQVDKEAGIDEHISSFAIKMSNLLNQVAEVFPDGTLDEPSAKLLEEHINEQIDEYRKRQIPLKPFDGLKLKTIHILLDRTDKLHISWTCDQDMNFYKKRELDGYDPLGYFMGADLYIKGDEFVARNSNNPDNDEHGSMLLLGSSARIIEAKRRAIALGIVEVPAVDVMTGTA